MFRSRLLPFSLLLLFVPAWVGCSPSKKVNWDEANKGGGVEEFTPPSLAELDAKTEWIEMPVEDALELLRAEQAKSKPSGTVAEALSLRNTSDAANEKILDVLGRLPASDSEVDYESTITRFIKADVKSTNPIMANSVEEFDINQLTEFGLFGFDWNFRPFADKGVVKSWQTSKDRMYDKVVMRDDMTWSDGRKITAHDVVFAFQTIMNPNVPIPAVRSTMEGLKWVEAYDDHTLVYFHKDSSPAHHTRIGFPIIPKHVYEETMQHDVTLSESPRHVELENNPVVGGPYRIVKRDRGHEIVLERREDYYMHGGKQVRSKPFFKTVRFTIKSNPDVALLSMKKGELDEMLLTAEQWDKLGSDDEFYKLNTMVRGVEWSFFYFGWNMNRPNAPFFADARVRQAMGYAFDHDEMLRSINRGLYEPSTGIFHPTAWMAAKPSPAPYKQNVAKAEELLDQAGWTDHDEDGIRDKEINGKLVPFEFTIICGQSPQRIAICNLLRQNLDDIGIKCNVKQMEATAFFATLEKHDYDANFAGFGTGTDPSTLKNLFKTGEKRNYNSYSNKEVDELLRQGELEFDREKRAQIYGRIHQLIYEDQPFTFLYNQAAFYGFNKQLRGYRMSARGPYRYGPGFSAIYKAAH